MRLRYDIIIYTHALDPHKVHYMPFHKLKIPLFGFPCFSIDDTQTILSLHPASKISIVPKTTYKGNAPARMSDRKFITARYVKNAKRTKQRVCNHFPHSKKSPRIENNKNNKLSLTFAIITKDTRVTRENANIRMKVK